MQHQHGDELHSLAQPHVVGQTSAKIEVAKECHP